MGGERTLSSFIVVEASFCIVALIASYELLVGIVREDEPPKQPPKQPRRRGRDVVGDEPRPAGIINSAARPYGRSLSPAGRGRAGSRALTTHIRSNEDTPLLPQSRSGAPQQQQTSTSSTTRRWLSFSALPPLTPDSNEGNTDNSGRGIGNGNATTVGASSKVLSRADSLEANDEGTPPIKVQITQSASLSISRFVRNAFASPKAFYAWNLMLVGSYVVVFVGMTVTSSETAFWTVMILMHIILLIAMVHVACLLVRALYPGIGRQKNSKSLAIRLLATFILIAIMIADRVTRFSVISHSSYERGEDSMSYRREVTEYALTESLPILCIVIMMHQKRKEVKSDVLIVHSLMSRVFGSAGKLEAGSQVENNSVRQTENEGKNAVDEGKIPASGHLAPRRYQSYGGMNRAMPPRPGYQTHYPH
ncbi:hypothetical protein THAOC_16073 [Thalassiosira oceanica]|uniref:THH1/TOM1/TOM3 domain-containing protein n=1 Tax=Thalassiosira oceanica TaxID=159749 RepID=K0SB08_THAOC|nr:hypothetical protein THAOC_16073 [Thalassiosira oceanica]|eukprot:EJK63283.1 hypothetical protein THAOC_16073 [Thalassiosira oceanica]